MTRYKQEQETLMLEIKHSKEEISIIENQLVQVREDKLFYKRKEDTPNFDKTLDAEIRMVKRISSLTNNINVLTRKLENLKKEELKSIKTRSDMDKVLRQLHSGCSRVQSSKNAGVSLSRINKWYDDGKNRKDADSIYFYRNAHLYESFYMDLYNVFKNEFEMKNKIHIFEELVPDSTPKRLDRFYNKDSDIWFSMLSLKNDRSLYYFGLKGDNFPRLMLLFDKDYHESNFRLYKDEVIVLLKFNDICDVKEEFRLLSSKKSTDLYYVSLGRLDSGKLTVTLELLIKKYIGIFSNPIRIIK